MDEGTHVYHQAIDEGTYESHGHVTTLLCYFSCYWKAARDKFRIATILCVFVTFAEFVSVYSVTAITHSFMREALSGCDYNEMRHANFV